MSLLEAEGPTTCFLRMF